MFLRIWMGVAATQFQRLVDINGERPFDSLGADIKRLDPGPRMSATFPCAGNLPLGEPSRESCLTVSIRAFTDSTSMPLTVVFCLIADALLISFTPWLQTYL